MFIYWTGHNLKFSVHVIAIEIYYMTSDEMDNSVFYKDTACNNYLYDFLMEHTIPISITG